MVPFELPQQFSPELTDERLRTIASALLDTRHSTLREMNSPFDDNYTRESTVFGRQRNMLIDMGLHPKYEWLTLAHVGMDLTFLIGNVPCRFFTDDAESPQKHGFFRRNPVDNLFPTDDAEPVMWRFVISPAINDETEDDVYFIGDNIYQEKVAEWSYRRSSAGVLHSVGRDGPPAAIPIAPASVQVLEDVQKKNKSGSNE